MFTNEDNLNLKIISVHCLNWKRLSATIPPKKSYAISLRKKGEAVFDINGEKIFAKDGDVIFFPRGVSYGINAGEELLYTVNFEAADEKTERSLSKLIAVMERDANEYLCELFFRLFRVWTLKEKGYYLVSLSIFYKILGILYQEKGTKSGAAYTKLKEATDYLNINMLSPSLSVARVAEHIGVSEVYFRRIFKNGYGISPIEYIVSKRVEHSKELLESGFYSVEDCAYSCGFSDPKYFSTVFKKLTSTTPSEYKKRFC